MKHTESFPSGEQQDSTGFKSGGENFYDTLRKLPPDAQEFITGLSSILMEPDIYKAYKKDETKIAGIKNELVQKGVSKTEINQVMKFFNFPSNMKAGK